jgi:sugar/nucleoside kinase (ribokinase family)
MRQKPAVADSLQQIHVLGDLNLDIILSGLGVYPSLGEEILAQNCVMKPGGSAANVALMLALNGCPVRLFAQVGDDVQGRFVLQGLRAYGVDTGTISLSKEHNTGLTVSLTFPSDRMYVTYPGTVQTATSSSLMNGYIKPASHLHLTSYFLQAALRRDVGNILKRAKAAGMSTSLDPGGDTGDEARSEAGGEGNSSDLMKCLRFIDYIMPSSDEICALTGRDELLAAVEAFPEEAKTVVVKAGSLGAVTRYHGKIREHPAMAVDVVDTTCAGDCFDAGFIYGLFKGETFQKAVETGLQFGAQAVSTLGLPSEDIHHFLSSPRASRDG